MGPNITHLQNGLRVVSDFIPHVETVTLGVWLNVGARHEEKSVNGIAHVLEHMAFKGTEKRNAKDIAEMIENVGGYVNAYTSRESTAYYTRLLKDDMPLGVDLLGDILQNSTFHESEFAREQSVILQEIGQTYDTPDDIIFDYFQETCFPNQPLGRPILGTSDIVSSLTASTVRNHMKSHYGAQQMVLSASGHVDHEELVDLAEQHFANLTPDLGQDFEPASYKGGEFKQERTLEQAHILIGMEGVPFKHDDYYATGLLATMLGGGMSSRLFQEIREKRGLVYSIYAFHSAFRDSGIFGVYAGTSAEQANELIKVTAHELTHFEATPFEHDLNRAKAQLKASLMMSLESTSSRCEQLANQMHIYGEPKNPKKTLEKVESVTIDDIRRVAKKMFINTPLTLTTLGPVSNVMGVSDLQAMMK